MKELRNHKFQLMHLPFPVLWDLNSIMMSSISMVLAILLEPIEFRRYLMTFKPSVILCHDLFKYLHSNPIIIEFNMNAAISDDYLRFVYFKVLTIFKLNFDIGEDQ